jgi:hypothetical protein
MVTNNSSLLKTALFADSAICFAGGIACLFFSKAIAGFLGIAASWIILALGVGVTVYAVEAYLVARAEPVKIGFAKFAAYGNLVWVLGSAVLIFANLVPFTTAGKWTIALIADTVLVLAIFEYLGLRRAAK